MCTTPVLRCDRWQSSGYSKAKWRRGQPRFLQSRLTNHETIVDLLSLVYSVKLIEASCGMDALSSSREGWSARLAELLHKLRRSDGGFSKSIEGQASSTYQTFLVLLCLELIEQPIPEADAAAAFLMKQRQADGVFLGDSRRESVRVRTRRRRQLARCKSCDGWIARRLRVPQNFLQIFNPMRAVSGQYAHPIARFAQFVYGLCNVSGPRATRLDRCRESRTLCPQHAAACGWVPWIRIRSGR